MLDCTSSTVMWVTPGGRSRRMVRGMPSIAEVRPMPLGLWDTLTMFMSCIVADMTIDVDTPPESFINDRRQDWLTELTPEDYSRCMSLLEELLGIPYRYSPEATAAALLRHLHNRPGGKRLQVAEMPPPALEPNTETDLHWIRDLTAEEQKAPFIVAYDVNAAYLAACSALPLAAGQRDTFCDSDAAFVRDDRLNPRIGYFRRPLSGCVTTPSFALDEFWPLETWVWRETSRPLEPWYKVLRDARHTLQVDTPPGIQ